MPRRSAPRCRRRGGSGSGSSLALPATVECCLVWGGFFDLDYLEIHSIADYAFYWRRWGDEITRRWIAGVPGSRPFALYILGEIKPPTWQHELPAFRHPLRRISGSAIRIPDTAWHQRTPELEHLVSLGLVDEAEYKAAIARIAGPPYIDNYRWIEREQEELAAGTGIVAAG